MGARTVVISLLALGATACASTGFLMAQPEVVLLGPPLAPRPSDAPIEVFQSQKPTRSYREVATISVRDTDDNWSMRQILQKAREVGADAVIILGRAGSYAVGMPIGTAVMASSSEFGLVASAVRYEAVLPGPATVSRAVAAAAPTLPAPEMIVGSALAVRYLRLLQRAATETQWEGGAGLAVQQQWHKVLAAIETPPDDQSLALSLRGFALFAVGELGGATEALGRAIAGDPKNALTHFFLGWVQEFQGQSRLATSAWRAAVFLDPTLIEANLALTDTYLRLGEPSLAAQVLCVGLKNVPGSMELSKRLAEVGGSCVPPRHHP